MGKYVSNRRWYRAVKRGMREADKQRRRNGGRSFCNEQVELNALGKWFKRQGWKGELLQGIIIIALVLILWFTGTWFLFLIICGLVWFVKALLS